MKRSTAGTVGLLAAGALAGGILAGTLTANAANGNGSGTSSDTGTSTASTPPQAPQYGGPGAPGGGPHDLGSAPVRGDESSVGSSLTTSLTKKAEDKTGGTVFRVETDSGDAAYEAHVQKSDGTFVTVKFNKDGDITAVEDGMGK